MSTWGHLLPSRKATKHERWRGWSSLSYVILLLCGLLAILIIYAVNVNQVSGHQIITEEEARHRPGRRRTLGGVLERTGSHGCRVSLRTASKGRRPDAHALARQTVKRKGSTSP